MRKNIVERGRPQMAIWSMGIACCIPIATNTHGTVAYPGILLGGSTNSVEDRENGDLGVVAHYSGVLEAAVILYQKFHFI